MQLKDLARHVPDELWAAFEPVLPERVWYGTGRPPYSNRACLHALLYVLVTGIAWDLLPPCFPSAKTIQRRLRDWLKRDAFLDAWRRLATRYETRHGINWDQILLDGSKKPAKKGVTPRGQVRLIAANRARPCNSAAITGPCR